MATGRPTEDAPMLLEIAVTDPARFEAGARQARPCFLGAEGRHGPALG